MLYIYIYIIFINILNSYISYIYIIFILLLLLLSYITFSKIFLLLCLYVRLLYLYIYLYIYVLCMHHCYQARIRLSGFHDTCNAAPSRSWLSQFVFRRFSMIRYSHWQKKKGLHDMYIYIKVILVVDV